MSSAGTASSISSAAPVVAPVAAKSKAEAAVAGMFAETLEAANGAAGAVLDTASEAKLRHEAQRLVSQVFFGTLLKQMRNSPFKSELWSGGRGGEAFSGLYDQHMADRMAKASGRKLVESIVKSLRRSRTRNSGAADVVHMDMRG
jgi:Rod binding domain-containing protein